MSFRIFNDTINSNIRVSDTLTVNNLNASMFNAQQGDIDTLNANTVNAAVGNFDILNGQQYNFSENPPLTIKSIYIDYKFGNNISNAITAAVNAGYTHIILAFIVCNPLGSRYDIDSGLLLVDAAQAWGDLDNTTRTNLINLAHNSIQQAKILVSFGGATEIPYNNVPSISANAASLGLKLADFVNTYLLDGIDFDLENILPGFTDSVLTTQNSMLQWIEEASTSFHNQTTNKMIIHAPQAPYFGPSAGFASGYNLIERDIGDIIDWYGVQYYNQGMSTYTTYDDLFISSQNQPGTAINEIATDVNPIALEKLVVGKFMLISDGGGGYVSPYSLSSFFDRAYVDLGWNTGVFYWQWDNTAASTSLAWFFRWNS